MVFSDKYVIQAESAQAENKNKIIISNDAYAVGEIIENLTNKLDITIKRLII